MAKGSPYLLDRRLTTDPDDAAAFPYDRVEENRIFEERAVAANMSVQGVKLSAWADRVVALEGGGGAAASGTELFETLTDVGTTSISATVDVIRTGSYSTPGDGGNGIYKRSSVPSDPTNRAYKQSADGAWWELVPDAGEVRIEQFGGKGDLVTAGSAAAATDNFIAFGFARDFITTTGTSAGGARILTYGPGYFYHTDTLEMYGVPFTIQGSTPSGIVGSGSILRWPTGKTGIIVHRSDTRGAHSTGAARGGADGSCIKNLVLWGMWFTSNPVTASHWDPYSAILMRARADVSDCFILDWSGCGIAVAANGVLYEGPIADGTSCTGNANSWRVKDCSIYWTAKSGLYITGSDANAGYSQGCDFSFNGEYGILDISFLGNTHIAHHVAYGGRWHATFAAGEHARYPTQVIRNGKLYAARIPYPGTLPAVDYANDPESDVNSWSRLDDSTGHTATANIPDWSALTTYQAGGSYGSRDPNARTVWISCYAEGGGAPCQFRGSDFVIGGNIYGASIDPNGLGSDFNSDGQWMGGLSTRTFHSASGETTNVQMGVDGVEFGWQDDDGNSFALSESSAAAPNDYALTNSGTEILRYTGAATARTFGRSATVPTVMQVGPGKLFLGSGDAARCLSIGQHHWSGSAAAEGDFTFNNTVSSSGLHKFGWARDTNSSNHVEGTDWIPVYGFTQGATTYNAGTLTSAVAPFTVATTWNSGPSNMLGLVVNVTSTAAAADSKLLQVNKDGNNMFEVFQEGALAIRDGITAPGARGGRAQIYVDTADGDLKVKFADGVVKTLATDT